MGKLRAARLLPRLLARLSAVAAISLLLALAACSSESDDDPSRGDDDTDEAEATEDGGSQENDTDATDGDETEGDADEADADDADEAEPLGSVVARLPASPNDSTLVPLRLDITALERLEGMVELRVTLTNEGDSSTPDFEPYRSFDDPRLPTGEGVYSLSGASLVDADAEQAYLTIVDSEGTCLCTGGLAQIAVPAGESFVMHADFGGLPDDLDEIDVQVPGFPTVDAVPIAS